MERGFFNENQKNYFFSSMYSYDIMHGILVGCKRYG